MLAYYLTNTQYHQPTGLKKIDQGGHDLLIPPL